MAYGWRCDIGCASWPDQVLYKQCPQCGGSCTRFSNLTPMDVEEAEPILQRALDEKRQERESAARLAAFERYYQKHCDKLGIPSQGVLSVEQVAMMDHHS